MYHEILPPSTHAQKEITCSKASLHPSEQFYMHKNTSASVVIVWELIELTEYCHLLKKALKVLWKCADVPRNSPTFHTCAEGDHLFQGKFTSQWTVLYGMQTCLGTGDLLLRMCGRWENFVVHLRTSRALSEPFLSRWQYSVNSISSHTMSTLAEVFLCI